MPKILFIQPTQYGGDGTTFRVPDTDDNRKVFGLPGSGRGQAGYPQVRLVALMALRSHIISAAAFGPCKGKKSGELSLAKRLWSQLPDECFECCVGSVFSPG